jgi:hypothetical protein
MSARFPRGPIVIAALFCLAALATGVATRGQQGGGGPARPQEKPQTKLQQAVVGDRSCASCHEEPKQYKPEVDQGTLICRLNEWKTFTSSDKHKNAMKVLADARAKRMGELLGIGDVTKNNACVSCHGLVVPSGVRPDRLFNQVADGVSCIACHGGNYDWIEKHQNPERPIAGDKTWRDLSREQKEKDFGMVDLWDPVTRAARCASCHVGNAGEGKVVTHTMYAAGHPPLPGVEIATFSDAEPRHWQYLREKKDVIQKRLDYSPADFEQAKIVAVSGLVPLREALKLFAAQARGDGLVRDPDQHWPDFARFDCYACHHDLQAPGYEGWRQVRGFADAPGRPPAPTWLTALVELGIRAADEGKARQRLGEFAAKQKEFRAALGVQPYGAKGQATAAADALVAWIDAVLADIGKTTLDQKKAMEMLGWICERARPEDPARIPDYDAARELYWAFHAIYKEYTASAEPSPEIDRLLASIAKQLVPDGQPFSAKLDEQLALPSAGRQEPIEATLATRLKGVASYNPEDFWNSFDKLSEEVAKLKAKSSK